MKGTLKLDIHARLMQSYITVQWWWWAAILLAVFGMSVGTAVGYDTGLPWWGIILGLVIPAVYMVPCGMIQGVTNVDADQLNVLSEFIGGYLFQGKPIANIYDEDQPNGFSCPNGRTVFSSSVVLGLVGPARLYSAGAFYSGLLHFFWIGLVLPPVTYFVWKMTRSDFVREVNWPLIFVGTYNVPPATGINYSSWYIVNFVFNKLVFRKFYTWWTKYNYVLAAALDTGLAVSGIVIFFAVTYGE